MSQPPFGKECLACKDRNLRSMSGVGEDWRMPRDYDDLLRAFQTGVPIHDDDGDCVREILRPGWTSEQADQNAAVYSIWRASSQTEYVRPLWRLSIWLHMPPTKAEEEAALETIRRSLAAKALVRLP